METNPTDLFYEYNKRLGESVRQKQVKDVVVIGPPRSGKTFFIKHYLSDLNVVEEIVGVIKKEEVDELKTAKGGLGKLTEALKSWTRKLTDSVLSTLGMGGVDIAELVDVGDVSGVKVPKEYADRLKDLKGQGKRIVVFYHIPSNETGDLAEVLKEEKVRFVWHGKEYVPPGLLKFRGDLDKLREQLRRYKKFHELLGVDLEKDIMATGVAFDLAGALREKAPEFVAFFVGRFLGLLDPLSLLVEIFVAALISKKGVGELYATLLEAVSEWDKLDDELKWLAAANLSLVFGLPIKEVYDGMQKLAGADVKRELEKLKNVIALQSLGSGTLAFPRVKGNDLIGLGVYDGKIYQDNQAYDLVTVRFEDLAKRIEKALIDSEGKDPECRMFFVIGPKGIGKSTLVHYVIADLLQKNEFTYAARVTPDIQPWAFSVKDDKVILFYDYYPYEDYTKERQQREKVSPRDVVRVIEGLRSIVENNKNAYAIVVLSDDVLNDPVVKLIVEDFRKEQKEQIIEVNKDLHTEDFIAEVVKSYSGCSNVSEVAKAIVDNYEGGYTLLAKYAGFTLKSNNCNYENVKKVLEESRNQPIKFLKKYIDAFLDQTHIKRYALPLLIHVFLGEVPVRVAKELPSWINDERDYDYDYEGIVAPWIATRKEDLVEEALREYLKDLIEGKNLVEYLRGFEKHDILRRYLSENKELKEIIEKVKESIEGYLAELKNGGLSDDDLNAVKDFIGYDEGLWSRATQNFYEVLKGWASANDKASKFETTIETVLYAVIREFLKDKLLQENDETSLKLLLKLAFRTAIQASAKDLFDEVNEELKENISTEDHEIPPSIRLAIHGAPPFINGLFNGYNRGEKNVKTVDSSWCEYIKQAEESSQETGTVQVVAGATLYLLSIPEKLSDECKEKILRIISILQILNKNSIYIIGYVFLRFLLKNNSLNNRSAYILSIVLGNIPIVQDLPGLLRAILDAGYMLRDRIKDETVRKIYTINVIRGLMHLRWQINESILDEAMSLMGLEDELLLPHQAILALDLMDFYILNGMMNDAEKLAERLEKVWDSLENVNWGEVAGQLSKKGIEEDKDRLKEKTKGATSFALARYYHERFDIEKEQKYVDAAYDATIKIFGGEEEAKENVSSNYFSALLKRDVINVVLGEDLGKALDEVVKDSEEAFKYSLRIATGTLQMIMREYLIASAYLGRLDEALKLVNSNLYLRHTFLNMVSPFLLGLYSLFHYLTGGKFTDKVREYAKTVANNEVLTFDLFTAGDELLVDIAEKSACSRAISEVQRGLMGYLRLNESEASYLIYIFLTTKPGIIALLSLGRFFFRLELVKGLTKCLAEYKSGAEAELLGKVSGASNDEEFKDALVRLAMYLSI